MDHDVVHADGKDDHGQGPDRAGTQPSAVPGVVRGAVQLADLLAAAEAEGFESEFDVAEAPSPLDHLTCPGCGADRPASAFARDWRHRLEGASDPADMLHVSALRCPACGLAGVFVSPFGPAASARQSAVLRSLPSPRREGP